MYINLLLQSVLVKLYRERFKCTSIIFYWTEFSVRPFNSYYHRETAESR